MSDINMVVLSGVLADAPRQIATQKGSVGVSFRLRTVRTYNGSEYTAHVSVKHFGDAAQTVLASAAGTSLVVSGRLELESWDDKNDNKRYELVVRAETVAGYQPPMPPTPRNPPATNAYGQTVEQRYGYSAAPPQNPPRQDEMPF